MNLISTIIWWGFGILSHPSFSWIATALTWIVALLIYSKQKKDQKINAALAIITEVRYAEKQLEFYKSKADNVSSNVDYPPILMSNSWRTYSHYFIRDFDYEEFNILTKFYERCLMIQELWSKDNNFFWVTTEERAKILPNTISRIAELAEDDEDFIRKRDEVMARISRTDNWSHMTYSPMKTVNGIKLYIEEIDFVTKLPIWEKLKKLAKINKSL